MRKLTIAVTISQDYDMDVQGIKEAIAYHCEGYGKILRVDVEQEPTAYEQMQMGFPRSEMERIVKRATQPPKEEEA